MLLLFVPCSFSSHLHTPDPNPVLSTRLGGVDFGVVGVAQSHGVNDEIGRVVVAIQVQRAELVQVRRRKLHRFMC